MKLIAAICAAPKVLLHCGLLDGHSATWYPGALPEVAGVNYMPNEAVVFDNGILTGRGPGVAIAFSLEIIRILCGDMVTLPFITASKSRSYAAINGGFPPLALWGRS